MVSGLGSPAFDFAARARSTLREPGLGEGFGRPEGTVAREAGEENIPGRARVTVGADAKADAKTDAERDNPDGLSAEQRRDVEELKRRDREVRAHEQAHMAAAGGTVIGGPSFSYQTGPDGRRYAVGGEVKIDTSSVRDDPRATIAKAQTIQAAALAPADPSGADRAVAAAAAKMEADAQRALAQSSRTESRDDADGARTARPKSQSEQPARRIDTYA